MLAHPPPPIPVCHVHGGGLDDGAYHVPVGMVVGQVPPVRRQQRGVRVILELDVWRCARAEQFFVDIADQCQKDVVRASEVPV